MLTMPTPAPRRLVPSLSAIAAFTPAQLYCAAARLAWDRARTALKSAHARARRDAIIGLCLRYTKVDVRIRSRGRRNRAVCAATRSRTFAINASACGDRPHICMGKHCDVNNKRTSQESQKIGKIHQALPTSQRHENRTTNDTNESHTN